jgi:hypothetical protein
MKGCITLLFLSLMLTACGETAAVFDPTTTAGAATTANQDTVKLRVFQEQRACCYTEGQVSFLSVNGLDHEIRLSRTGLVPLIEIAVPLGAIEIESWQQPCSGNCGFLDPPANQCSIAVDASSPQIIYLLISFAPGPDPCEFTMLQEDPATSVPLGFGFRRPLPSCGEDFTMQEAMYGDVPHESEVRRCFVGAHMGGEPAEMTAYIPQDPDSGNDDLLDLYTYRTQPDAPVEVFVNVGPDFVAWQTYTCDSLTEVGGPELFQLEGCSDPQPAA